MTYELGISLYYEGDVSQMNERLKIAAAHGLKTVFSSVNIREMPLPNAELEKLIALASDYEMQLIVDINDQSVQQLDKPRLKALGLRYVRLDDGISLEQMRVLARDFTLVLNASTLGDAELALMDELRIPSSQIIACHNFYPKPYTGLSFEQVRRINRRLQRRGILTMAFVPGDGALRGPLHEGLPTVEEQRGGELLRNVLELKAQTESRVILTGDCTNSAEGYARLGDLAKGFIRLRCVGAENYLGHSFHDRIDSSPFVIRAVESRALGIVPEVPATAPPRLPGMICVGNAGFLRYAGELEIVREPLPPEARHTVVGRVVPEDLPYLPYIREGQGFILEKA